MRKFFKKKLKHTKLKSSNKVLRKATIAENKLLSLLSQCEYDLQNIKECIKLGADVNYGANFITSSNLFLDQIFKLRFISIDRAQQAFEVVKLLIENGAKVKKDAKESLQSLILKIYYKTDGYNINFNCIVMNYILNRIIDLKYQENSLKCSEIQLKSREKILSLAYKWSNYSAAINLAANLLALGTKVDVMFSSYREVRDFNFIPMRQNLYSNLSPLNQKKLFCHIFNCFVNKYKNITKLDSEANILDELNISRIEKISTSKTSKTSKTPLNPEIITCMQMLLLKPGMDCNKMFALILCQNNLNQNNQLPKTPKIINKIIAQELMIYTLNIKLDEISNKLEELFEIGCKNRVNYQNFVDHF